MKKYLTNKPKRSLPGIPNCRFMHGRAFFAGTVPIMIFLILTCMVNLYANEYAGKIIRLPSETSPAGVTVKIPVRFEILQFTVTGKVTDSLGNPLIGVSVSLKGTSTGTVTDANGHYSLVLESGNGTLVFSFVGFEAKEVAVNGRATINLSLSSATTGLNQLVVVGYGTQRKGDLTAAITQVSGDKLENRVLASPVEGLEGLIPGLNVSTQNTGGLPGSTPSFNIRGVGSLNSDATPYVLVDGTPQNLNTVDPQSIESITVLKGPAASAIYGSRAAFGVILVTTKTGNKNGGMHVSYSTHIGWNAPTIRQHKASSVQWAETINYAAANSGTSAPYSDEVIQRMKQYIANPGSIPAAHPDANDPTLWSTTRSPDFGHNANGNTQLYDYLIKDWSGNQTHHLAINGGNQSLSYYASGGFYKQIGLIRFAPDNFKRYNLTLNLNSEINKWLDFTMNAKYNNRYTILPHSYSTQAIFNNIYRKPPNLAIFDPNGNVISELASQIKNGGRQETNENTFSGSVSADVNPLPGWNIIGRFDSRLIGSSSSDFAKPYSIYTVDGSPTTVSGSTPSNYFEEKGSNVYQSFNLYTTYQKNIGRHFIKGTLGGQTERYNYSTLNGSRSDIISASVPSLSTATGTQLVGDSKGHWATDGVFARLNYNYNETYLFEFDARYDGSSRFPEDKRWGFFPSVSAGYNIANESFWSPLKDKINQLKIRASYGSLGNQDVENYLYIPTLNAYSVPWMFSGERLVGVTGTGIISNNITWETVRTFDAGLDMNMLKNRLSLTFDWYQRSTLNMLGPARTLPGVLGAGAPKENNANLRTRGFELSLGWKDQIGQVHYHIEAMLADHQTEVTKYRNDNGFIGDFYDGMKLGQIWGYTTVGLFQSDQAAKNDPVDQSFFYPTWNAGDIQYADINGDGKVNDGTQTLDDHGDLNIIGNSTPRYVYSFTLGADWNGFGISMLWQGIGKRDLWLGNTMFFGPSGTANVERNATILKQHLNYWKPDNMDAYYPKPYINDENDKNTQIQTRYLQNGAYLRLKSLQVSYSFPKDWLNKLKMQQLQIYFSGENLLLFTPLMNVFDPEGYGTGAVLGTYPGQVYPVMKTVSLGLNISL